MSEPVTAPTMEQLFNIHEASLNDGGVLTLEIRRDFIETIAWALRHCPDDRRHKAIAGILASQMMRVAQWLYDKSPLDELVDRNGRGLVEFVVHADGREEEFRKNHTDVK